MIGLGAAVRRQVYLVRTGRVRLTRGALRRRLPARQRVLRRRTRVTARGKPPRLWLFLPSGQLRSFLRHLSAATARPAPLAVAGA